MSGRNAVGNIAEYRSGVLTTGSTFFDFDTVVGVVAAVQRAEGSVRTVVK